MTIVLTDGKSIPKWLHLCAQLLTGVVGFLLRVLGSVMFPI